MQLIPRTLVLCTLLAVGAVLAAAAPLPSARPPVALAAPALAGPADDVDVAPAADGLAAVSFLVGRWTGTSGDDVIEELWSPASGDSMVGSFKWLASGETTSLVELITIVDGPDGVTMRLRHFSPTLVPWASEVHPVTLQLVAHDGTAAVFRAQDEQPVHEIRYELVDGALRSAIAFPDASGREPLVLRFARR